MREFEFEQEFEQEFELEYELEYEQLWLLRKPELDYNGNTTEN
ncbi:hypothetical protein NQU17_03095 [Clostridiaceae bacterium HFYG-1003]|nr:hypothetical protein NQU17_03095 [Clostridiaceae bacterium HFYG-1003]